MMIAMSASVNAFAAESNLDGENRQTDIGVYARYIDNTQWNTVPMDDNGRGTTTLPDGTEITVSGALKPGWQLVIDPITETDAENWISGILDGKAKDLAPFHIYFIDGNGNPKTSDGVTVTVKLLKKLTNPVAYSLASEGKISGLTVTAKDGFLTFTTDGSPFYVLGEKNSGGTNPIDPDCPSQTGDNSLLLLWVALLGISAAGIVSVTVYDQKRKKDSE